MKLQLFTLASGSAIALSFLGVAPSSLTASAAALAMLPVGFEIGATAERRRRPDANAIRQRAAAEATAAGKAGCEIRLSEQRSRLESQANERIIEATAKAASEAEIRTAARWKAHSDRIEAAAAQVRAEAETNARNHAAALSRVQDIYSAEAAATAERHAAEIETLNDRLAKLESIAAEYRSRERYLKIGEEKITKFRSREGEVKTEIRHLGQENHRHARTIQTLQKELHGMQKAAVEQYQHGLQVGAQQGRDSATEQHRNELERRQLRIEQLENKIATLETQLKGKADRDRFEKSLPELSDIIARAHKPLAVEGSQGSGKALAIANAIATYANGLPAIVLVLDVSEADDPDSSWRRLGIPCTGDPLAFADFLCAAANALPKRPHRNNRDRYDRTPPIFAVIDEALCAFDQLDEDTIKERIRKPLRALESRGQKRKVYPVVATQDGQIQNLRANGITLWNTGTLKNYYKILLNDGLREAVSDAELERDPDLSKFIDAFDGKFIAAIESVTGRGKRKQPIKHPSHHNLDLLDTVPNRGVERIEIAPMPAWLPRSCRDAYAEFAPVQPDGASNGASLDLNGADSGHDTAADTLPDNDCADLSDVRSPAALAQKHGLSEDEVIALLDSFDEGYSMTKAVTAIAPKSSSKKSKYQRARALYLSLKIA
jgi:hypothetical protein